MKVRLLRNYTGITGLWQPLYLSGLAEGKTISQGIDEMDKIADKVLDDTFRTALAGDSKDFKESSSSLMFAFGLALVLIFLVLAAQFESFKDPDHRDDDRSTGTYRCTDISCGILTLP